MARIPQTVIDDIRERSNIVDIVGQYVQLKKSGKNYFGLCPFHNEKSPSFLWQKTSRSTIVLAVAAEAMSLVFARVRRIKFSRICFESCRNQ